MKSNMWYFTFELLATASASATSIIDSEYRRTKISTAQIVSFSMDTTVDSDQEYVDICGYISSGQMRRGTWLKHTDIRILELVHIHDRFNDRLIIQFLHNSALPDSGESAVQGRRLSVDTMAPSDATRQRRGGRKRTKSHECEVGPGAGSVAPPPQLRTAATAARPAPTNAGAPVPAPRSTGGVSAQPAAKAPAEARVPAWLQECQHCQATVNKPALV
jgi:hypothetical protein